MSGHRHLTDNDKQVIQQVSSALGDFRNTLLHGGVQPYQMLAAWFITMCSIVESYVSTINAIQEKQTAAASQAELLEWMGLIDFHASKFEAIGPWMHEFVTQQMMLSTGKNPGYFFGRGIYNDKVIITIGNEFNYEAPPWVTVVIRGECGGCGKTAAIGPDGFCAECLQPQGPEN